jgi:hypothetical protein
MDLINLLQSFNLQDLSLERGEGQVYLLKIKDVQLKLKDTPAISSDYLELVCPQVPPFKAEVQDMALKIPKEVLEVLLNNFKRQLDENGILDLKVKLTSGKIEVKGSLKKAMNLPFSLELYLSIEKNKLKIEIGRIQVLDVFSLPGLVKDIILSLVKSKVPGDLIVCDTHGFLIDIDPLLPIKLNLTKIEISEHALVFFGGTA